MAGPCASLELITDREVLYAGTLECGYHFIANALCDLGHMLVSRNARLSEAHLIPWWEERFSCNDFEVRRLSRPLGVGLECRVHAPKDRVLVPTEYVTEPCGRLAGKTRREMRYPPMGPDGRGGLVRRPLKANEVLFSTPGFYDKDNVFLRWLIAMTPLARISFTDSRAKSDQYSLLLDIPFEERPVLDQVYLLDGHEYRFNGRHFIDLGLRAQA